MAEGNPSPVAPEEPQFLSLDVPVQADPIQRIKGDEDFDRLSPGTFYLGPDNVKRQKPWSIKNDTDFDQVPEGAEYVGPDNVLRKKPKYESIGFTAQTLFDMAANDEERKRALENIYPGKVKKDPEGFLIDDEGGIQRRPGRGPARATGAIAAGAAPAIGSVLGGIGGGIAGTALSGPGLGTGIGAVSGAFGGGAVGQGLNDSILALAGIHHRTQAEEITELGAAGGMGALGEAGGMAAGAVVPLVKGGVSGMKNALPAVARNFLGEDPAKLRQAIEIAELAKQKYGIESIVPPSAHALKAPHLHNLTEVFDPAMDTSQPLLRGAVKLYEGEAREVLDSAGAAHPEKITEPVGAVPTAPAGEALLKRAQAESAAADARLDEELRAKQAEVAGPAAEQRGKLQEAFRNSREAAQKVLDGIFNSVRQDVDLARRVAEVGGNPGDLWRKVGAAFQGVRDAGQRRFNRYYQALDDVAGNLRVPSEGLADAARGFLAQLPEGFEQKYPAFIRQVRDMAGEVDAEGKVVKEAVNPTWVQLRHLRTFARYNVNWSDLPSDVYNGSYKWLAHIIDDSVDVSGVADPRLQLAAQMLNETDAAYGEFIRPFKDQRIQAVMDGLRSDLPADPKKLYDTIFPEGRAELMREVQQMVGPQTAQAIKAADLDAIMQASRSSVPGAVDAGAFAREVMRRHRADMLEAVHGKDITDKLLDAVQKIEMLQGKLDVPVRPGDKFAPIIERARAAEAALKEQAKRDPLKMLANEAKKLKAARQRELKSDPLGFLYEESTGAAEAADRILGSEDLLFAAAERFGKDSPEFQLLQQTWLRRILEGTLQPSKRLEKWTEEAQALMAPGTTLKQLQTLAKNMDFLMETRSGMKGTARSMAAMAKVENPEAQLEHVKILKEAIGPISKIPIVGMVVAPGARSVLGFFYSMVRKLMTRPATLRWIAKGLEGTPEDRQIARAMIRRSMQRGGAIGAGASEQLYQQGGL